MEINIITSTPNLLKNKIFKAAADEDETLKTWKIVEGESGTKYLTPLAEQYKDVVMLIFTVDDEAKPKKLIVTTSFWKINPKPSDAQRAIVLGMITATLLTHFKTNFEHLETK